MSELFVTATKEKYTFPSDRGELNIYDLWDLPLTSKRGASLDVVARTLHKSLKDAGEVSFVDTVSKEDVILKDKLEIVKYIIEDKKAHNQRVLESKQNQEKAARIREILSKRKDEALEKMSEEELLQTLNSL